MMEATLVPSRKLAQLEEAVSLASEETLSPLLNPDVGNRLFGQLIPDADKRHELLSEMHGSCLSSINTGLNYLMEDSNVPEELARLGNMLGAWESKTEALLAATGVHSQPLNPYDLEKEKATQLLRRLNQSVDEYKAKIVTQRTTISALLENIVLKRDEVESRLSKTQELQMALKESQLKIWSAAQQQ